MVAKARAKASGGGGSKRKRRARKGAKRKSGGARYATKAELHKLAGRVSKVEKRTSALETGFKALRKRWG